jgi:YVTN family beta-propeller protein
MPTERRLRLLFLAFSFVVLALPVAAQQVIATVPVGINPTSSAVNPATNRIYVANASCIRLPCPALGTVSVIDGATNNTVSVNVGYDPDPFMSVNQATNKIYVANLCGNDPNCGSGGTVSVIDGVSNTVIATVTAGGQPYGVAVNSMTNKIYATNFCGNDTTCQYPRHGTVTVIDGATDNTLSVNVGYEPVYLAVNQVTNKIYVANSCGSDPACASDGTVSVIDGASNTVIATVTVGSTPLGVAVNSATNQIYVTNYCGNDVSCNTYSGTVTVIDGGSNTVTATVNVGAGPYFPAVNSSTNQIYVSNSCGNDPTCPHPYSPGTLTVIDGATNNPSSVNVGYEPVYLAVNQVTNKIYVANSCGSDPNCVSLGTVTVIDGATLATTNIFVGDEPAGLSVNSATNRVYVPNFFDNTVSVIDGTSALQFVPLPQPCRAVDTRPQYGGGGPIQGGTHQDFAISGAGDCGVLTSAAAYSLNVTVVPQAALGYLTIWPAGQPQPVVSTLNSLDGRVKADAAILPAGANGEVSVYVTDTTNVILDVNGYFAPVSPSTLAFYPITPCRVADTRVDTFPTGLGPPQLFAATPRDFPVLNSPCIPSGANPAAYSFNFTVVPGHPVGYLTVWPTGQSQPVVSTLNDQTGTIVANAAIVPAGTGGDISVYSTHDTQLLIDIDGYFAPAGQGGLSLYGVQPCRVIDTRKVGSGQPFSGILTPPVDVVDSPCGPPATALAYVFNATVVPTGGLGYLTLWPDGTGQPVVSTLNAFDGALTNNMAIVPTNNGKVDAYANGLTQLILDISSYFAP